MPELPEVEVLVRALRPHVVGRRIGRVRVDRAKLVENIAAARFRRELTGRRLTALARRGKTICAALDDGRHWLTHLRMTGWLDHAAVRPARDRHVLARFRLDDETELHFRDPRRFGRMWLLPDSHRHFARLGPEPLGPSFSVDAFAAALRRRSIPIKQALLDPRVVAGVGNIYASEACFAASVNPSLPAGSLDIETVAGLRRALRRVLRRAIRRGATVATVAGGMRAAALYPGEFAVYGRAGRPCRDCGSPILRTVLGARATFFCPACQP